jgi:hypothetical protein
LTGNAQDFIGETFDNQGVWNSWSFHSAFAHPHQKTAKAGMLEAFNKARESLLHTDVLLITWGTANVFTLLETNQIVANNHKMPAALFTHNRMSVQAIVDQYSNLFAELRSIRPNLKVVLSVSPVRHLRDGFIDNQRSKAVLTLACEMLEQQCPEVSYFPAYEILMDDLRDYRFYAEDMLHPNAQAVAYIWEAFTRMYFSEPTQQLNLLIEKIRAAQRHRPFHADTPAHKAFAQKQLDQILVLEKKHPFLDFQPEKAFFSAFI